MSRVFSTLRSVTKKLIKDDVQYRTLDTTNSKVMERLPIQGRAGLSDAVGLGEQRVVQEAPVLQQGRRRSVDGDGRLKDGAGGDAEEDTLLKYLAKKGSVNKLTI